MNLPENVENGTERKIVQGYLQDLQEFLTASGFLCEFNSNGGGMSDEVTVNVGEHGQSVLIRKYFSTLVALDDAECLELYFENFVDKEFMCSIDLVHLDSFNMVLAAVRKGATMVKCGVSDVAY